jgi:hypothetical protein
MTVNNIDELIDFILQTKLSINEVNEVIRSTLKVIVLNDYSKEELAVLVNDFYNKYSNIKDRPLFLDCYLNIEDE